MKVVNEVSRDFDHLTLSLEKQGNYLVVHLEGQDGSAITYHLGGSPVNSDEECDACHGTKRLYRYRHAGGSEQDLMCPICAAPS